MKPLVALVLLLAVLPAQAADYPTAPDEMDKLCEVIGEAPNVSIPPRDRLWFKESCLCLSSALCGRPLSDRFLARIDAATKALNAKEAGSEETVRLRAAYRKCKTTGMMCEKEMVALDEACKTERIPGGWDGCLSGR
jgi:hypothetical protein